MEKDTSDWCSEGMIRDHRVIRKLRSGSKTDTYLAVDSKGQKVMLTIVATEKLLERYRFKAHIEGADIGEVDKEAEHAIGIWLEEYREMIERIKGLGSDHVATTYGFGLDQAKNSLVVVSEYIPGVDFQYVTRGLKPIQMISLFAQVLEGLKFIHQQGFLHLNVKPQRIRVDVEGEPVVVKFTDFGFAIPKEGYKGEYNGTSLYIAPEVAVGRREVIDERADLYSFAIMAYYCLTNRHPTERRLEAGGNRHLLASLIEREGSFSPPSHYVKEVPPELECIIMSLLEKEPEKRSYSNAVDLVSYFYEQWPKESRDMPHEYSTLTSYEG